MNILSLIEKALFKSFQSKLKMSEKEAQESASLFIQKVGEYKPSAKEQKETEMFHLLGSHCDTFQHFIQTVHTKYIDTIFWLSKDSTHEELSKAYEALCHYEYSYRRYNKDILELLDISNIGNRTSLGQFLLHPSKKYSYFENEIIKAYIKGLKYWKIESKDMSQNEEDKLKSNIEKILNFYPFIKANEEAMSIEIPKCKW